MYVHPGRQIAYLAHPRTASGATAEALLGIGFTQVGKHHGAGNLTGLRVLTTVRNSWDAAVSWVFGRCKAGPENWDVATFKAALKGNHWIKDHRMWFHLGRADEVLRYETLREDLREALGEEIELPRRNVATARHGRDYREFYTPETERYIGRLFGEEIAELGYQFDKEKAA